MIRFVLVILAAIGLGSLLFGSVGVLATGLGFLLLAPLVIAMKILFFIVVFGLVKAALTGSRGWNCNSAARPRDWMKSHRSGRRRSERRPAEEKSDHDRFEEWHRMEHARKEVDSWVDPQL